MTKPSAPPPLAIASRELTKLGLPAAMWASPAAERSSQDDADEDPVVAAVVVAAEEEADRIGEEDHRQGECDAAEGAFDDVADHIADRAGDVPPFEGGDDDREPDEEEGRAVPLRR